MSSGEWWWFCGFIAAIVAVAVLVVNADEYRYSKFAEECVAKGGEPFRGRGNFCFAKGTVVR